MNVDVVIGCPGSGKSTYLARLARTLPPEDTLILSYSRSAARSIARKAGPDYRSSTIHAMCFRDLGLRAEQVLNGFIACRDIGYPLVQIDGYNPSIHPFDIYSYARTTQTDIHDTYFEFSVEYPFTEYAAFVNALLKYKKLYGLYEFHDMLSHYQPTSAPKHLLVDESNDNSKSITEALEKLVIQGVKRLVMAGDPNQSIFMYAGADPTLMHYFGGKETFLDQSYRCPKEIVKMAKRIVPGARFKPTGDPGHVAYADRPPLNADVILVRTNYLKKQLCGRYNIDPIKVMTFHKSKGLQFDHVALLNSRTQKVIQSMEENKDAELKVLYTAVTRSKEKLTIIDGRHGYPIF